MNEALKIYVEDIANKSLETLQQLGATGDFYFAHGVSNNISYCDYELEECQTDESSAVSIRSILPDGRQGIACASGLGEKNILSLASMSVNNAKLALPKDNLYLCNKYDVKNELSFFDEKISNLTVAEQKDYCNYLTDKAKEERKIVSVRSSGISCGTSSSYLANSLGFSAWEDSTFAQVGLSLIAEDGASPEMNCYGRGALRLSDINLEAIVKRAVSDTVSSLNPRGIKNGLYDVVIEEECAAELLGFLGELFCASDVHKGKSMMAGKIGKQIASSCVTLFDSAVIPWAFGSSNFDAEGCPTGETLLIKDGIATSYLYNMEYAAKDGVKTTGNACRSFGSLVDISTNNLVLQSGAKTKSALIKELGNGFYVTEFMGLHTADPISGNFSLGVRGRFIENGELTSAGNGATMAGNFANLWRKIVAVSSDNVWSGSISCPAIVLKGVVLAGE